MAGNCSPVAPPLPSPSEVPIPKNHTLSVDEPLAPVSPPYSLAILTFEDYSNRTTLSWLRQALPEMLVTDLALLPGVKVVSRQRLGEVLREQWLQQRGTFEESASVRLGKLVGARYLLTGMFYLSEGTLLVEGHLIDVERGAVVRTVRVSGSPESIPSVEMALASKLGSVFSDPQEMKGVSTNERDIAVGLGGEVAQEPAAFPSYESNLDLADDISSIPSTSSMALRTDSLLRMERLRTMRDSAAKLANDIWERAVSIQVGSPEYKPISQEPLAQDQTLNVLIPVIAQLQGNWFNGVRQYVNVLEGAMNSVPNSIVVAFQSEDPGAQQVFVEAMHAPRRLFVRAIGEGGQVVAVSSQWEWRVDQRVHVRPDGTIGLSVAPAILLKGRTSFPGKFLVKHGATIRFDSVIAAVPDEARIVSIEPISDTTLADESEMPQLAWLPILRVWVLQRWMPTIAESIPVRGYLPGNVRRTVVILEGTEGTIHSAQVLEREPEENFDRSIQKVIAELSGQCFSSCEETIRKKKSLPKDFRIRLEFELIKDIRFAGLNKKP